jgi:hypothetical protein
VLCGQQSAIQSDGTDDGQNCSVLLMVAELGFTDTLHCHLYHQMKEG